MTYSILSYTESQNLGDAIQSIALARLLSGRATYVDRQHAAAADKPLLIVNGFLGSNEVPDQPKPHLFVGVHLGQIHNLPWLRQSPFPIGARDPYTASMLARELLAHEMVGCASMTFPRYYGPRCGVVAVDADPDFKTKSAIRLSHGTERDMPWVCQLEMASALLEIYRKASLVYTSRLHVVLPCLAFGTPVVFHHHDPADTRFTILSHLGFHPHIPMTLDLAPHADRYTKFLLRSIDLLHQHQQQQQPSPQPAVVV